VSSPLLTPLQEREREISRRRRRIAELEAGWRHAYWTGDAGKRSEIDTKLHHQRQELRKLAAS
jgi:hypothetical protein